MATANLQSTDAPYTDTVAPTSTATEPLNASTLEMQIGFHARMAQAALSRGFNDAAKPFNLTQMQVAVMLLLRDNHGADQTALASKLQCDRATMMAIVDRLQKRHLLKRHRSVIDRRKQELSLTQQGLNTLEEAWAAIQAYEKGVADGFTTAEVAQLVTLMRRLYDPET